MDLLISRIVYTIILGLLLWYVWTKPVSLKVFLEDKLKKFIPSSQDGGSNIPIVKANVFCSLRPVTVQITDDLVFQGVFTFGPLVTDYVRSGDPKRIIFSSKSGDEQIILVDRSKDHIKTYEFALSNDGYEDLSLVGVSYFQVVWNYRKKDFFAYMLNGRQEKDETGQIQRAEKDELKEGMPRFLYEQTNQWFVSRDFKVGNTERKYTSPAISVLSPTSPLTDVYVFNVLAVVKSDGREVKKKYIFMVRDGIIYEEKQYVKFDDNSLLLRVLKRLEEKKFEK